MRMTAKVADMTLDWCTDYEVWDEEEQKHESDNDFAVPANVSVHQ